MRIESSPWVAKAAVRFVFPDELRVSLTERRPRAILAAGGLWYVDGDGSVFKKVEAGERMDLPIISGLKPGLVQSGEDRERLIEAVLILDLLDRDDSPLRLGQISELHFNPDKGAILHPLRQGPMIILGRGMIGRKMDHWRRVMADLKGKALWPQVDYVDLRLHDKAFVGLKSG